MKAVVELRKVKLSLLIAAFVAAVSAHAWYYVTSILAIPDIPDLYARS